MAQRAKRRPKAGKPKGLLGSILAVFLLFAALVSYFYPQLEQLAGTAQDVNASVPVSVADGLTVHFLDVGQGDSALLLSGGEAMLIDGGPRSASEDLAGSLAALGVTHLDYLVATHPHEDHIGGLPTVLETVTVDECWMPDDVADSQIYETFLTALDAGDIPVTIPEPGDTTVFGDCTITVLAPLSPAEDHNNNSIVLKVVCGETSFLFTGDMEEDEEDELLASGTDLSADVLKVAHHGSRYTTSTRFLEQVKPEAAVISCGAGNSYGHPHDGLIQRLEYKEIPIYRTDLLGTITIVSDGTQLTITTEQEAAP